MTISLVIPTLNEQDNIGKLLVSAKNQIIPFNEIIVVDSGSTDNTLTIAEVFTKQIIITGKRCINYNRNIGVRSATSEIVVMVDADCILPKDYTKSVIGNFTKGVVALIIPVFPLEKHIPMRVLRGINNILMYFVSHITGSIRPFAQNMPVLRKAFIDAGGFPSLERTDEEETELYRRLTKIGLVVFDLDTFCYTSSRKFLATSRLKDENKENCKEMM